MALQSPGDRMSVLVLGLVLGLSLCWTAETQAAPSNRTFTIDYERGTFLKDGEPIRLVSGSIQYFRVHPSDWVDRLRKLRYAGFNTLETYIEWSSHETEPGMYDFSGMNNFTDFLLKAQQEDLLVILRPGPYIDAERDMGGLPYWLLREKPSIKLRTMDPVFLEFLDTWFRSILLPMVRPLLYSEGGPVVMVQVENEYGSYPSCDYEYTSYLRDLVADTLGPSALLFSTDGDAAYFLKCGKIPEVYATVDFGSGTHISDAFKAQRLFEPHGPLMNSEYYPGWLDHWGDPHSMVPAQTVADKLDEILSVNASVNVYVFHGGTNFGLTAGSNEGDRFQACPTSYDYDAPVSEAGDLTDKYYAIREVVGKYLPLPSMPAPSNSSKFSYGNVSLEVVAHVLDVATIARQAVLSTTPMTFEALSLSNGLVVYETVIEHMAPDPALLIFKSVNDRGYVYLDGLLVGLVAREQKAFEVPVFARQGQKLEVVVESQGRLCYGAGINDAKGIIGNVTLGSRTLTNWSNTALHLADLKHVQPALDVLSNSLITLGRAQGELMFYNGSFQVPDSPDHPQDTFLELKGWNKGIAWINDFCIGRYWPVMGPQLTLYVPRGILHVGSNSVMLLELEGAPCGNTADAGDCSVSFTTTHDVNGPTPE